MELRSLEQEVNDMASSYLALHCTPPRDCDSDGKLALPPLLVENMLPQDDGNEATPEQDDGENKTEKTVAQALSILDSIRDKLAELAPKMDRYRKRLTEKDPVTEAPRYGAATFARVTAMLATFDALTNTIRIAFGENEESNDSATIGAVVSEMRLAVQKQEEEVRQAELELAKRTAQEEAERLAEQEQLLERERQAEAAERLAQNREEEELAQRAQETRRARQEAEQARLEQERLAREEQNRLDREWMQSIVKGPDGVRQQLAVLREATNTEEHGVALKALHMLFSQIAAHPEEIKYRRVRRDHPKFHQDIGRHAGGRELLIAAGFRLGAVDDVSCFISTEPDIEKDMDGWSEWFNLLKATLEILEEELIK